MTALTKNRKDISKQPLQRVFRVGREGVALGFPEGFEQACFLMAPDKDYTLANDFLYALHSEAFDEHCLLDPPDWMNQRRSGPLRPRSVSATAQALAIGIDLLEARKVGVLEVGNSELKRLGSDLAARGVESGIGFVQATILKCSAWAIGASCASPSRYHTGRSCFGWDPRTAHVPAKPRRCTSCFPNH